MEGVSNVSFFIYFVLSLPLTEVEIFYSFGLSYSRTDFYSRYLISFVLLTRYLSEQYTLYKKKHCTFLDSTLKLLTTIGVTKKSFCIMYSLKLPIYLNLFYVPLIFLI